MIDIPKSANNAPDVDKDFLPCPQEVTATETAVAATHLGIENLRGQKDKTNSAKIATINNKLKCL